MSASVTLAPGTAICHLPHPFRLVHGGVLETGHVAYEVIGPTSAPVVAVLGGISASRHVAAHRHDPRRGWWEGVVGDGCAVDTGAFRVLSIDWLCGAGESTRPGPGCSVVDVRDQARALCCVLDALGIERLHAVVGGSYGGMVALAFAVEWPNRVGRVCTIAAAQRPSAVATAARVVQRRIVRLGLECGRERDALQLARALAMVGYRGRAELERRFGGGIEHDAAGRSRCGVEEYLDACGARFAQRFTAEAFLCLSQSIDACRIDPADVRVPATVVGIRGDELVTPAEVAELARRIGGPVRHVEIDSERGHDGFLLEVEALAPVIAAALGAEVAR